MKVEASTKEGKLRKFKLFSAVYIYLLKVGCERWLCFLLKYFVVVEEAI